MLKLGNYCGFNLQTQVLFQKCLVIRLLKLKRILQVSLSQICLTIGGDVYVAGQYQGPMYLGDGQVLEPRNNFDRLL